ncbi:competence type IV pilus assembly protein ComGB [Sporosarcina jiandibaonis]|uniref:competence type IV pilus assembly protein ComGB n=1 Tax=Sporosarcina jiandibaonis TaxID=2715535 RepID=UPI00155596B8|nr:competence type IV pilus assembly protein ComGB [Sporosarcina jiandibaonis]
MIEDKYHVKRKLKLKNRPEFLSRLAVLLKEGYTFYDSVHLLLPHHVDDYQLLLTKIESDFRDGESVTHILSRLEFSSSVLLPVIIAERDGRLAETLSSMAGRLEKTEEAKKKLKGLLAYPAGLFIFISFLLLGFRKFFLPNIELLASSRSNGESGLVQSLPKLVAKTPDIILGVGFILTCLIVSCIFYYKKLPPPKKIKYFISIPIIGDIFTMWKTRLFSSELGSLLLSGLSMQDSLDVLINQNLDPVLSEIANEIKKRVIYGEPFDKAVALTDGLTKQFSSFVEHGTNSGHLPKELIIYSEYLENKINKLLENGLAILQPVLFSLIAICILAAYIALLLPMYGMIDKI